MDTTEVLDALTGDLATAQAELQLAEAKVAELEEARRGLEFAIARYGQTLSAPPSAPLPQRLSEQDIPDAVASGDDPEKLRWYALNKQDRIVRAMQELQRSVTVPDIRYKLAMVGFPQDARNIKSSLNAMKKSGKVVNVRAGLWDLPGAKPANNFGPAEEAGPKEASDDGASIQENVITGTFGASQPVR